MHVAFKSKLIGVEFGCATFPAQLTVTKHSPPTAPSVGFISLGYPKNLVDSVVMRGHAQPRWPS
jgi:hypothetical protein